MLHTQVLAYINARNTFPLSQDELHRRCPGSAEVKSFYKIALQNLVVHVSSFHLFIIGFKKKKIIRSIMARNNLSQASQTLLCTFSRSFRNLIASMLLQNSYFQNRVQVTPTKLTKCIQFYLYKVISHLLRELFVESFFVTLSLTVITYCLLSWKVIRCSSCESK